MKTAPSLDALRRSLDGRLPASIATAAPDGTPNVTFISQVHYLDGAHVALSFQFFNKTRENILANPFATVQVIDPATAAVHRLRLRYLHTETEGPRFERLKAQLAGIASHTGMQGVFHLRGADIYRVLEIEAVAGETLPEPAPRLSLLNATQRCCRRIAEVGDLAAMLDRLMEDLGALFGIEHAMVLMLEAGTGQLYTVASRGYPNSGIGSEIPIGQGVIGVAARERTPIRIPHMTSDYAYSRAVRAGIEVSEAGRSLEREIPLPGLAEPRSQLAVPILAAGRVLGVLFAESLEDLSFGYDEEDALTILAAQLGTALRLIEEVGAAADASVAAAVRPTAAAGAAAIIRHYAADESIFVDEAYLIKGVAGAIFWKLLREHEGGRRSDFTNRELRLDPSIPLPEISENLEARLILLQRRLQERSVFLGIEKTGRGRFRLKVERPLKLVEMGGGSA
jgi:adenylate cyclase